MISVNFLPNNFFNLSVAEPDYVKLFLFTYGREIFVRLDTIDKPDYVCSNILQMKRYLKST